MVDIQTLISMVDALPPEELEQLYEHVRQRRHELALNTSEPGSSAAPRTSPRERPENIRAEFDAMIDKTLDTVKRKRETQELMKQVPDKK